MVQSRVRKRGSGDGTRTRPRPRPGRTAVRLADGPTKYHRTLPTEATEVIKPFGPDTNRRGDLVREQVLQAALECFAEFGFEGTSTRAVAGRANVTHSLVLYHFESKHNLWIATMDSSLSKYMAAMRENFETTSRRTAEASLRLFIEQFVRMSARTPQMHRILSMESNQGTARLQWVIDHFLRAHYTLIRDLIRRGQSEGTVRDCDPARLYYHIIGAGSTPYTVSTEYKALTGRDVFSETEVLRNIAFIYEIVFI